VTSYLPNTRSANLRSEGCRTLHDMVRFAMGTARQTMFDLCTSIQPGDRIPKQLVEKFPMQYWVVDLDDAVKAGVRRGKVHLKDIVCPPLHALWRGLTAVPWAGPPPVNAKGFLSIMFECTRDPCMDPAVVRGFAGRNYIIVSSRFCSLTSRLGFHFATAAAYMGKDARENYVAFQFRGGAACVERRQRRVGLISRILQEFGFFTDIEKDDLYARIEGREQEYLEKCLVVLGHVMTHTRQLDMAMCNDAVVDWYYDEIMKGIASLPAVI
jgi:pyruvate,water dikinase